IHADRFAEATERAITSELVRDWPNRVGSVSQWADATDVLDRPALLPRLRSFYTGSSGGAPERASPTGCVGIGVRIFEDLGFGNLGVHAFDPGFLPQRIL